jgi:hypothetical protein
MAPLVQHEHAPRRGEEPRLVVPGSGVSRDAVQDDDGWVGRCAPFDVMEALPAQDDGPVRVHGGLYLRGARPGATAMCTTVTRLRERRRRARIGTALAEASREAGWRCLAGNLLRFG